MTGDPVPANACDGAPAEHVPKAAERLRGMLRDRAPRLASAPSPLVAAIAAAAAMFGRSLPPGAASLPGETPRESAERLSRMAGLLPRAVMIGSDAIGETPAPLLVFDRRNAAPALVRRRGRRWSVATETTDWRPRRGAMPEDIGSEALLLQPALPDGPLKTREILLFGLRSSQRDLLAFLGLTLLGGTTMAVMPLVTGPLFASVVPERETRLLVDIVVFLCALFAGSLLARFAAAIARLRLDGRIALMLRAAIIERTLRLADLTAAAGGMAPPPPIAAMAARSVERWQRGARGLCLTVVSSLAVAAPSVAVIATASPRGAAFVGAAMATFLVAGALLARARVRALLTGLNSPHSWMATAHEGMANIETIRASAAEERLFSRWTDGFLAMRHRFLRADRTAAWSAALEDAVDGALMLCAVLALAMAGGLSGSGAPIGMVFAAGTAGGAVIHMLGAFGQVTMLAMQHRTMRPILEGNVRSVRAAVRPPGLKGHIVVERLTCRHRPGLAPAVADVSFTLEPGTHLGIAGASGSGKSTLIRAMLGLMPIEGGTVRFDGLDIAGLDMACVRRQIGVVGQSGRLLQGTLHDNVAAGTDLTPREVMDALGKAGLAADVEALPLGLGTPIGAGDGGFSGGQVQRILLARAFATRPRILILDEATSALDAGVQASVAASIDALDATVIAIAHRLDTLRACERILVLEHGRVVERGSYDSLARDDGHFAAMLLAERPGAAA